MFKLPGFVKTNVLPSLCSSSDRKAGNPFCKAGKRIHRVYGCQFPYLWEISSRRAKEIPLFWKRCNRRAQRSGRKGQYRMFFLIIPIPYLKYWGTQLSLFLFR